MEELSPSHYARAASLFASLQSTHLSVAAILTGEAEGEVLVDDQTNPSVGLLDGPEGVYLGGAPVTDTDYAALRAAIDDWAYLHVAPEWEAQSAQIMPHPFMLQHPRLTFNITPQPVFDVQAPTGFDVQIVGEFGCRVLFDGTEVSRCLPDVTSGERTEIGVWTHLGYRRKGLAMVAARTALAAAARHGLRSVGWHCHASNAASARLATRLGGELVARSVAYSASLPAENPGDLDRGQWLALGEHFDRAATSINWMSFHAAGGWALAGNEEQALLAIERLVDSEWSGNADWLVQHWALVAISRHPRFLRCVERQRNARN